jgi:hypothetical protein
VESVSGITSDPLVRVTDRCGMSCEVESREVRFEFENATGSGLQLAFDWRGFVRFMRVACLAIERVRTIPTGAPIDFEVIVDNDDPADIIAALRMSLDVGSEWIPMAYRLPSESLTRISPSRTERHLSTGLSAFPCVMVTGGCTLTCIVLRDEIQFRFGNAYGGLQLFLNSLGLAKLMRVASYVVNQLRSIPDGACIDFKVRDDDDKSHQRCPEIGEQKRMPTMADQSLDSNSDPDSTVDAGAGFDLSTLIRETQLVHGEELKVIKGQLTDLPGMKRLLAATRLHLRSDIEGVRDQAAALPGIRAQLDEQARALAEITNLLLRLAGTTRPPADTGSERGL